MQDKTTLEDALALMRDLRARCEWDAAQTHDSLRPYLIEEAHELDDALRAGDDRQIREELGDLLLQVLFHSVIAEERGAFDAERCRGRSGGQDASAASAPVRRRRARAVGADESGEARIDRRWPSRRSPRAAPRSPPAGSRRGRGLRLAGRRRSSAKGGRGAGRGARAATRESRVYGPGGVPVGDARHLALEEELGDLLFACVNLCRKAGVHASLALDRANEKFARRFQAIEAHGGGAWREHRGRWDWSAWMRCGSEVKRSSQGRAKGPGRDRSALHRPLSGPQPIHHPRKRDHLANVRSPADPRDRPLQAQAEAGVHERAVLPQVEVPPYASSGSPSSLIRATSLS